MWMTHSQRMEKEADGLLAYERTSEALLAYYRAWTADPKNHSAIKKMIPLYRQQGRQRQAGLMLQQLTSDERAGLVLGANVGTPRPMDGVDFLWMQSPVNMEPAGLAVDDMSTAVAYVTGQAALLKISDGSIIWTASTGQTISTPPTLTDKLILLGTEAGRLIALDRGNGSQQWVAQLPGAIRGGVAADNEFAYTGSSGDAVTAVDLSTGTVIWQSVVDSPVTAKPLLAGDLLYVGTTGGKVWALDRKTGKPAWDKPANLAGSLEAEPALAGNMLYIGGNDSRLTALALNGREYYWQYSTSDSIYASPLVDDTRVYVFSIGQTAAALDRVTGAILWQQDLPAPVRQTPVLAGKSLFFATLSQPYLYRMDAANGTVTGQADTGDWIEAGPVLTGSRLLLAGKDGAVIAYRIN